MRVVSRRPVITGQNCLSTLTVRMARASFFSRSPCLSCFCLLRAVKGGAICCIEIWQILHKNLLKCEIWPFEFVAGRTKGVVTWRGVRTIDCSSITWISYRCRSSCAACRSQPPLLDILLVCSWGGINIKHGRRRLKGAGLNGARLSCGGRKWRMAISTNPNDIKGVGWFLLKSDSAAKRTVWFGLECPVRYRNMKLSQSRLLKTSA